MSCMTEGWLPSVLKDPFAQGFLDARRSCREPDSRYRFEPKIYLISEHHHMLDTLSGIHCFSPIRSPCLSPGLLSTYVGGCSEGNPKPLSKASLQLEFHRSSTLS